MRNIKSNKEKTKKMKNTGKAKIRIYSTPTCPYCHMAKDFFKQRGIAFEDIDVSSNQEAAREMIRKTGMTGVPQIEINGRMIVGFNKKALEKELKNL